MERELRAEYQRAVLARLSSTRSRPVLMKSAERAAALRRSTTASGSAARQAAGSLVDYYRRRLQGRAMLADAVDKAQKRAEIVWAPLDVPRAVFSRLRETNSESGDLFFKLALFTPQLDDEDPSSLVSAWLHAKFRRGAVGDPSSGLLSLYSVPLSLLSAQTAGVDAEEPGDEDEGRLHVCVRGAERASAADMVGTQAAVLSVAASSLQSYVTL